MLANCIDYISKSSTNSTIHTGVMVGTNVSLVGAKVGISVGIYWRAMMSDLQLKLIKP